MSVFEEKIQEIIVLSDLISKQKFRVCFIEHFTLKLKYLSDVSMKIDDKILQRLQLKLLEPLLLHLKTTSVSDDKVVLIECIIQLLNITLVHTVNEFFDIYTVVFFQIFKEGNLSYQPSEELQNIVLKCISILLKNTTPKVLEDIYEQKFGEKLSLGVSISINIVQQEKSIKLRTAALDFLLAISQYKQEPKFKENFYDKVGDIFMLYLPGILAPLMEVILRDETQHHLITTKALSCWGHVVWVVMRDCPEEKTFSDIEIVNQWVASSKESKGSMVDLKQVLQEKKRSKLWLQSVAITLQPLITNLSDIRKHSHPKCRLELTHIMANFLNKCSRNLKICLPVIIEVLVSSAVDDDPQVRALAEKDLAQFEADCEKKNVGLFVSAVEENLYLLIHKLPRVVRSGNEKLFLPSLKSLAGYLKILGRLNQLQHLIGFSSTLRKFISVLKISFELDMYPELLSQDLSAWDDEESSRAWCKPWKRFRYFACQSIKSILEEICRDLGKFCQSEMISDFLLDTYKEDFAFKKEILLILNEVISGSKEIEDHEINHLLEFYLDSQNLYPSLDCNNPRELQSNVVQVALIMEGIGKLAERIGNKFKNCIFKSLYYVLERIGSSYSIIRETAKKTAMQIAVSCTSECTVKALIQNNIDYLSYHLTVKLKRNHISAFDVVTVVMRNSSADNLPYLEEIIHSMLKSSSGNFNSPHTLTYLKLFQTFVMCVRKWLRIHPKTSSPPPAQEDTEMSRLLKYFESLTEEQEEQEEEETEMENDNEEKIEEEPQKPELPKHLSLTLEVAYHCLHHLASNDNIKKIIVLEILNECVWALANEEDHLLPLVHNIWSPLVTRFELITDPLIISRSFTLLCTLSFTSKDFIRKRTLKNVLPALEYFLTKQAIKSKLKNSASGYFFTQNFKLQRELLSNLGKLTCSLTLFERESDLVIESALPYLSSFQPQELQEKCRVFFEDLKTYDAPLVWFKVKPLLADTEFTKNANIVLSLLN